MGQVYSSPSNVITSTPLLTKVWRLRVPENPALDQIVRAIPNFDPERPLQSGTFYPSGSALAVVIKSTNVATGWEFGVTFRTLTEDDHDNIVLVLTGSDTLLLQDVLHRQWYCQAVERMPTKRIQAAGLGVDPVRFAYEITANMVEVVRPAV